MKRLKSYEIRIIDLPAILHKRVRIDNIFIHFTGKVQLSGVRASITIVHIRKFFKIHKIAFDSVSLLELLKGLKMCTKMIEALTPLDQSFV